MVEGTGLENLWLVFYQTLRDHISPEILHFFPSNTIPDPATQDHSGHYVGTENQFLNARTGRSGWSPAARRISQSPILSSAPLTTGQL